MTGNANDNANDYESPCVRVCVIDQQTGYCVGCGRTLHEISYWTRYTPEQRQHLLRTLPSRMPAEPRN